MASNLARVPPPPDQNEITERVLRLEGAEAGSLVLLAVVAGIALCYYGKLVIITLLVSIILALVLSPIVRGLMKLRLPRTAAALIVMLLLAGLVFVGANLAYNRASSFASELPKYSERIQQAFWKLRRQAETVKTNTEKALPGGGPQKNVVKVQQQKSWSDYIATGLGTVTDIVLAITFIPFLAYFMLTWQGHLRTATLRLFERSNRSMARETLEEIAEMIRGFIVGNVIIGLIITAASAVAFALLHVPYWYFLAPISGFVSLIPYLGVPLAAIPPLVALLGSDEFSATHAIGVVVVVTAAHLVAMNVLYPKFLGPRVQLNPLAVTASLLIWSVIWGAIGLLLAVPITAAMKIVFDHVEPLKPYGDWLGE